MNRKKEAGSNRNKNLKKAFKKINPKKTKKNAINLERKQNNKEYKINNSENIEKESSFKDKDPVIYKTNFDDLLELIEQKKIVRMPEVIQKFNIDKKIANEWGNILSENNLINFYVPVFGEPEFRDKNIANLKIKRPELKKPKIRLPKINLNKKKIIIDMTIMVLVLSVAFGLFYFLNKEKPDLNEIKFVQEEEIKEESLKSGEVLDNTKEAFSGRGSYECRTKDNKVRYFIKDSLIKIERIDGTSKLIIKNNKTYTFNVKTGEWIETEIRQGISIPGSGIYPKVKLECERIEVDEKEFIV